MALTAKNFAFRNFRR